MNGWDIEKLTVRLQEQIEAVEQRHAGLVSALEDLREDQRQIAQELAAVRLRLETWMSGLNAAGKLALVLMSGLGVALGLIVAWVRK